MSAFVVGQLSAASRRAIADAVARAGLPCEFFETVAQLSEYDEVRHSRPYCMFIEPDTVDAAALVSWVRDQGHLFDVPIVAFTTMPTENAFSRCLEFGADDVMLLHDMPGVTRRVASLSEVRRMPGRPETTGRAVVCDTNEKRRRLIGRTLRCAGYDLCFAHDLEGAARAVAAAPTALVVLAEAVAGGGLAGAIAGLRTSAGSVDIPIVALGSLNLAGWSSLKRLGRVGLLDSSSPSCHLLFQVNELMNEKSWDLRTSPRLLHSTLCAFRKAGDMFTSYGLTYNINRGGLFVRTLDAPSRGSIAWLELRPSASEPAVHLRGEVVWICHSDPRMPASSPPGFGVRLDLEASPRQDASRYLAAYDRMLIEEGDSHHLCRERPIAGPSTVYA